jgi:hypothetical protein
MRLTEVDDVWEVDVGLDESLSSPEIPAHYGRLAPAAVGMAGAALSATVPAGVPVTVVGVRRGRRRQKQGRSVSHRTEC